MYMFTIPCVIHEKEDPTPINTRIDWMSLKYSISAPLAMFSNKEPPAVVRDGFS